LNRDDEYSDGHRDGVNFRVRYRESLTLYFMEGVSVVERTRRGCMSTVKLDMKGEKHTKTGSVG
jgi:hypothetical protein